MSCCGTSRLKFENTFAIFEIGALKFGYLQKSLNLRLTSYLGNFGLKFENIIVIFEISDLELSCKNETS